MLGQVNPVSSQEHKVREALQRAGVSHDATVIADLSNIAVGAHNTIYFCRSTLTVTDRLTPGDGGSLPGRIKLEGNWEFPARGIYDIHQAHIYTNGAIHLQKGEETELVGRPGTLQRLQGLLGAVLSRM